MADVRLIDANALVEYMCGHCGASCNLEDECCADVDAVKKASTITPDDIRPRGRWVDIYRLAVNPEWICRCSLCGCPQDFKHHYCPNCGAKMDGKAGDTHV